ncbi:MAG: hypothetical protein IT280_02270 [Ignavibacteria bacterium]|nr:hypothetical protein [Ignavibacteria bacterium]
MNSLFNKIFDLCVEFLLWLGGNLGLSYKAINVIIFCIIWPILTVWLIVYIFKLRNKIKKLIK